MLKLNTPWRDGTTHLVMPPLEFVQRLAALVPRPRLHLIRFVPFSPKPELGRSPETGIAKPCEAKQHHRPCRSLGDIAHQKHS